MVEELEGKKEFTVFGRLFYLILERLLSSNSNASESIKLASKDLKDAMYDEVYSTEASGARNGIQAKVSAFFKVISDELFEIANLEDKKYSDSLYNAYATYLFCSPLLIESKGQYKPFFLEDIVPSNDEPSKSRSKKNEFFSNILFNDSKRPNVYKICQLSTFLTLILLKFNLSCEDVFYKCISLLRKKDFTFFCDSKVVLEGAIEKWKKSNKNYICEGMLYDRNEIFFSASSSIDKDIIYASSELIYLTIAWFDGNVEEESRKAINRWIYVVMGDNFKEAFDYWKYLWIRYRRLPIDGLIPEQHSLYTVDNIYVIPTFYDLNKNECNKILSKKDSDLDNRVTLLYGDCGKTSFIHTIISIISMSSSYATYRGGKQMGVSPYYQVKYDKLREKLFGDTDKSDIIPLIVNGEKFSQYLKENTNLSLIEYAYYLIQSYDSHLNLSGERNVTWFDKWREDFTYDKFNSLIMGSLEDGKLLLLVDGYDELEAKYQKSFDDMIINFINTYGNSCEMIVTAYGNNKIPNNLKVNYKEFYISSFNDDQYKELITNFIFNVKQIGDSAKLNNELIEAYNLYSDQEVSLIEEKLNSIKSEIKVPTNTNSIPETILHNPLFLTNVLFKRINTDSFMNPFSIDEADDFVYIKAYTSAIINDVNLGLDYSNLFKIKIFNILEKIVDDNKVNSKVNSIFEYQEEKIKKYSLLNNSSKMICKVSYDDSTAAQIKEYIKFISKNIG